MGGSAREARHTDPPACRVEGWDRQTAGRIGSAADEAGCSGEQHTHSPVVLAVVVIAITIVVVGRLVVVLVVVLLSVGSQMCVNQ